MPDTQADPSQNEKNTIFANPPNAKKTPSYNILPKTNVQYNAHFISKITTFGTLNNFATENIALNYVKRQMRIENKEKFIQNYRFKIGDTIKNIREKKGYSQDELAEIMNVNRSTISKIENGKFNLSLDYLSKFSWFLDFEFQLKETKNNYSVTQI